MTDYPFHQATESEVNESIRRAQHILKGVYFVGANDGRSKVQLAVADLLQDLLRYTERVDISFEEALEDARHWERLGL